MMMLLLDDEKANKCKRIIKIPDNIVENVASTHPVASALYI
jgi:hypothetical protein